MNWVIAGSVLQTMPLGISNNLFLRIVSAVALLPPVLGSLYLGGIWFALLLGVAAGLMAYEWSHLTLPEHGKPVAAIITIVTIVILLAAGVSRIELIDFILAGLAIVCLGYFIIRADFSKRLGWGLLGTAYVALPMFSIWWLRSEEGLLVLWVLLVVWGTDIGGYFAGKAIGGPKLAPKLSPKKTWAGLLGGMVLATLATVVFSVVIDQIEGIGFEPSIVFVAIAAAALAVWAQVGDLAESGIKRFFDVKDSGGIIPGHGGLLDRVDGLVFVAPVVALLTYYLPQLVGAQ